MNQQQLKVHVQMKQIELIELQTFNDLFQKFSKENNLSAETIQEMNTRISSKMAQIEISIRDHSKLIKT